MNTRLRPENCCTSPKAPVPLAEPERARLVAIFKVLADANRLEIFRLIAAQDDPICACDVVERFALTQPTISHHLKILAGAGLVTVSRRGVWAYYAVDPAGLALTGEILTGLAPALAMTG